MFDRADRARRVRMSSVHLLALAAVVACQGGERGGAGASAGAGASTTAAAAAPAACPGDNGGITLPAGFCATVFADSIGDARHLVVAPNGDVYVTLEGTQPSPEKQIGGQSAPPTRAAVVALRDTTRDGRADVVERIGGIGNTGIGLYDNFLYVDRGERIVRFPLANGALAPTGAEQVIVRGFPMKGHRARNFVVTPDGALLVNVGSETNSCQRQDRTAGSPGVDPCTELRTRAGIWRFDAGKTNQSFTPAARWAAGIRNAMGIAIRDGQVYATQHGRDQLHDNWPQVFPDAAYQAENPGEELVQVNQGDDFGWPYCYYSTAEKKQVTAPEYGGDGKKTGRCDRAKVPVAVFPGHWAPMSLLFYTGSQFPAKYRNGAFVAFHGSWNRAPLRQAAGVVAFQPLNGAQSAGAYEIFADGFAGLPPDRVQPGAARHRPVGLAQGPDGALYISDDAGGRIWRVTYGASR